MHFRRVVNRKIPGEGRRRRIAAEKTKSQTPIGVRLCALLGKYVGMEKAVLWGHCMQRQRKVTIWARVQPLPGLKVVSVVPWVTPLATAHSTASA